MKPFLRWAGSKRQLVPELAKYWNAGRRRRYVEPFMGSASLFFHLGPDAALLGDLNSRLVATYQMVKNKPSMVAKALEKLPKGEESYYEIRSQSPDDLGEIQRAARFIYLNRFCFNGLYRTNQSGEFNVPYGGEKCGRLPTKAELREFGSRLANATLETGDFEAVVRRGLDQGDFVYLDPPYSVVGRRVFTEYGPEVFDQEDLGRLIKLLKFIAAQDCSFVLSYANDEALRTRLEEWQIREVSVQRNIAGFSGSRRTATELVVTNIVDV